jgi:serine/threonine-protein kinase
MPLSPSQVIFNRYRIVKLLGQGGFGAVYRAYDLTLKTQCAVKENLDLSPEAQHQFQQEAIILAGLRHPNLPRVNDHFFLPGQGQYLVMDYVEGDDLQSILDRSGGPLPEAQAITWITQVCDALAYLHSHQPPVIHRDIKPANIKITPDGRAVLVDFGIAKVFDPNRKTTIGARAVTPGFSPPEQYGQGTTDARTDVYALGATLYALLTCQQPLESVHRLVGDTLHLVHQVNAQVSPATGHAIARAMALPPGRRFQNVSEFKSALAGRSVTPLVTPVAAPPAAEPRHLPTVVVQPPPQVVSNPSLPQGGVVQQPAGQKVIHPPSPPAAPANRRLWIAGGAGLLALLCLGGLILSGIFIWQDQNVHATETQRMALRLTQQAVDATSTSILLHTAAARRTVEARQTQNAINLQATQAAQTALAAGPTQKAEATLLALAALARAPSVTHLDGPYSGSLTTSLEYIARNDDKVTLSNFVIEVVFSNPYPASEHSWDFGLMFRREDKDMQYLLAVESEKKWRLYNDAGPDNSTIVAEGEVTSLDLSDQGMNKLMVIANGAWGAFYINGLLVSELDLSGRYNSGDIYVASGIYKNGMPDGSVVRYSNFDIWSIP